MKSLAELKRTIKPGLRLKCVRNTYRPELDGKFRTVTRTQTNGFYWKHEEGDTRESWTSYPKASLFVFDGSLTFSFSSHDGQHSICLEVLL